jgi:hypothetical protein
MTVMVVTARNLTRVAVELLNVVMDTVMVMKPKHHVQKIVVVVALMVARKAVMTVNLIGQHTDLNAVIRHGVNMVLIVLHWKVHMAGIVPAVNALVMRQVNVVTAFVMLMKTVKPAKQTAAYVANVVMVRYLTVPITTAAQRAGLVMALLIVKISNMAVI